MWKSINICTNLIQHVTEKATLIKCPNKSKYKDYMFWHSNKLIRDGKHSHSFSLSYTEEFTVTLKKYGKGQYNSRTVIDTVKISVEEFEEMFGIIDENIQTSKIDSESYLTTIEPKEFKVEDVTIIQELKNE